VGGDIQSGYHIGLFGCDRFHAFCGGAAGVEDGIRSRKWGDGGQRGGSSKRGGLVRKSTCARKIPGTSILKSCAAYIKMKTL